MEDVVGRSWILDVVELGHHCMDFQQVHLPLGGILQVDHQVVHYTHLVDLVFLVAYHIH